MRFVVCLTLFLSLLCKQTGAQPDSTAQTARNSFYIEAGGAGGYGSFNFENFFHQKNNITLNWRAGLFIYHMKDYAGRVNPDLIIPLGIGAFYGKSHHLEAGIGQIISMVAQNNNEDALSHRSTHLSTSFLTGYRYQKKKGGLFFRVAYTPMIENNTHFRHWGGMSIGYSF